MTQNPFHQVIPPWIWYLQKPLYTVDSRPFCPSLLKHLFDSLCRWLRSYVVMMVRGGNRRRLIVDLFVEIVDDDLLLIVVLLQ